MKTKTIKVATDFSKFPAGRHEKDGPHTGEGFRKKFLSNNITEFDKIIIDFDGTLGGGSSFLEEAFGGLVRIDKLKAEYILNKLDIVSQRESIKQSIVDYIQKADSDTTNKD